MIWRLIIVDDDASYAQALADSLRRDKEFQVAGIGGNGVEAVRLARETQPDVILMDISMPIMGGLEAMRRIKGEMPAVEILTLTVQEDDASLFEALQAGAKGYLLKDALLEQIAPAVRSIAQGMAALSPALAARVLDEFGRLAALPPAMQRLYRLLTRSEVEVLKLIGSGQTNTRISALLGVEMTTIKKQVTSILKKLEVNTRTEAALVARQCGLLR